jgi:hypothetical protein
MTFEPVSASFENARLGGIGLDQAFALIKSVFSSLPTQPRLVLTTSFRNLTLFMEKDQ